MKQLPPALPLLLPVFTFAGRRLGHPQVAPPRSSAHLQLARVSALNPLHVVICGHGLLRCRVRALKGRAWRACVRVAVVGLTQPSQRQTPNAISGWVGAQLLPQPCWNARHRRRSRARKCGRLRGRTFHHACCSTTPSSRRRRCVPRCPHCSGSLHYSCRRPRQHTHPALHLRRALPPLPHDRRLHVLEFIARYYV